MSKKLSHSAVQRYLMCGQSYKYHYVEKIRPNVTSAALLMGSALDTALNELIVKSKKDVIKTFIDNWEYGFINRKRIHLPNSTKIVYAKSDLDLDILIKEDWDMLSTQYPDTDIHAVVSACIKKKNQEQYVTFTEDDTKLFNFINWVCLKRKGLLIIDAYKEKVIPRISKVLAVQKEIKFTDTDGTEITGFIDLIAEMDDGNTYILDNKSSSRLYSEDSARHSAQLALYAHHEGLDHVGFIVFSKSIKKNKLRKCLQCGEISDNNRVKTCNSEINGARCGGDFDTVVQPEAQIQIILDKISDNMVQMVMDNFEMAKLAIENKIFLKNLSNCTNYYGSLCPYYYKCHKNSNEGLEET